MPPLGMSGRFAFLKCPTVDPVHSCLDVAGTHRRSEATAPIEVVLALIYGGLVGAHPYRASEVARSYHSYSARARSQSWSLRLRGGEREAKAGAFAYAP